MAFCEESFGAGLVLGLVMGVVMGLAVSRRRWKYTLQSVKKRVSESNAREREMKRHQAEASVNDANMSRNSQSTELGTMEGEVGILNNMLVEMWPYISEIVKGLIYKHVETALQRKVPNAISGISFNREACHLGQTPMRVRKLVSDTEHHGSWHNIKFVTELVLDGDCYLELIVPNGLQDFLGSWAPSSWTESLKVGISHFKFRGTLVTEFTRLVPMHPLVSGIRYYFINPPYIDLTLVGAFSGVLNANIIKQYLLDAITESIGNFAVLPNRRVLKLQKELNIFKLKFPRPEGILRVSVEGMSLATSVHGRLYIRIVFGQTSWQTVMDSKGKPDPAHTSVDLCVLNQNSQRLCVEIYEEVKTVWSTHRGELLALVWVPAVSLITNPKEWWTLRGITETQSEDRKKNQLHNRMSGAVSMGNTFSKARTRTLDLERSASGNLVRSPQLHEGSDDGMSSQSSSDGFPESADYARQISVVGGEILLSCEWRSFESDEVAARMSAMDRINWLDTYFVDDRQIACKLFVGIYLAGNLPCPDSKYVCEIDIPASVPLQKDTKASQNSKDASKKKKVTSKKTTESSAELRTAASTRSALEQTVGRGVKGVSSAQSEMLNEEISAMAVWDLPFFFYLRDPRGASVSFSLSRRQRLGLSAGVSQTMGSVSFDLGQLLAKDRLRDVIDLPIRPPVDNRSASGVEFVERSIMPPYLRVEMKLWMLEGPFGTVSM